MKKFAMTLLLTAIFVAAPLSAQARQRAVQQGGRTYVAHTRRAPVVLHRALPPFRGEHIYSPGN